MIARALDAGYQPISFLMERKQITGPASEVLARCEMCIRDSPQEVRAAVDNHLAQGYQLTNEKLTLLHNVTAVSYTHLDVYKRQPLRCPACHR